MTWLITIANFLVSSTENSSNSTKTVLNYDIIIKEKIVGTLKATKYSKDDKVIYQSTTTIKTRFITEIAVNYNYDVIFEKNIMKKSQVVIEVNNKTHANTQTKWTNNNYEITKNDKLENVIQDEITYSTILLYFNEPLEIDQCFSEQDGSFNKLLPLGNHSYKKINSKRKENIYNYNNGRLERASIDGGLVDFEIVYRD
ncbi:hypothetical protein GH721_02780 [Kriegella sp. EG-1]|nr:hypothetical protein [Flavobacteriaceae bacterium EG-1]